MLAKNGLSVSQLTTGSGGEIGVTTILMHTSGEWLSSTSSLPIGEEKGKSQAMVAGSIISYLRRYSLASILGMYAEEDTDGHTGNGKAAQKPAPVTKAEYWKFVHDTLGWDAAAAKDVATRFENDYTKALEAAKAQQPA